MSSIKFTESEQTDLSHLGVLGVFLFGSHATGTARATSDYDFGLLVRPGVNLPDKKLIYTRLYDLLSHKIQSLVDIDIVFLAEAPLELRMHVVKYGAVIFTDDSRVVTHFMQHTMEQYADFAPLRNIFTNKTLGSISL